MRFRNPDQKLRNTLGLMPPVFLVLAVVFFGYQTFQYLTGVDDVLWLGVGAVATLYFGVRCWMSLPHLLVWGEEEDEIEEA